MSNTIIMRKLRTASIALTIFAIGTGIGWQVAGLLFQDEATLPIVASIQFEGSRPHEAFRPRPEAAHQADLAPSVAVQGNAQSGMVTKEDEHRKFAEVMQWAERYRLQHEAARAVAEQRQNDMQKVAAAEAPGWAVVAENAKRFAQGQLEVQKVIKAQVERERAQKNGERTRIASATARALPVQNAADPVVTRTAARGAQCTDLCKGKMVHKRATTRAARQSRSRSDRGGFRADTFMCPLRWLQMVLADPVAERRGSHRHRMAGW